MPEMTPVADKIIPPDPQRGIRTFSDILGIQQQKQALQTGQYTQASAKSTATQAQQKTTEMQSGAQLLSDPVGNGLIDSDGNPTKDAQKIIYQAMPTTGAEHYKDLLENARVKVDFNKSVNNLNSDERSEVGSMFAGAGAGAKSRDEVESAAQGFLSQKEGLPTYEDYKRIVNTGLKAMDGADKHQQKSGNIVPIGQEGWRQAALGTGRQVLGAAGTVGAGGIATPSNTTMPTATGNQPGTMAPALQGGGFSPQGPVVTGPPNIMQGPGNQIVRVAPGGGSVSAVPEAPTNAPAPPPPSKLQPLQKPGVNALGAEQENYKNRIKQFGDEVAAVSAASNDPQNGVQVSRYRNGQILGLTKVAPTGPGKEIWNHIASQIPGEGADAFQKIGHYLAQNSAAMAGKMGVPNTNMGQQTAAAAAGNTAQNPQAIAEITRVNDALNTGFDLYNRGLAKVTGNGSDLSKVPAYKQAFGSNVDVNALRWADAHRRNDSEEIASLTKMGPQAIAEWQKKLATLKSLAVKGDLP